MIFCENFYFNFITKIKIPMAIMHQGIFYFNDYKEYLISIGYGLIKPNVCIATA